MGGKRSGKSFWGRKQVSHRLSRFHTNVLEKIKLKLVTIEFTSCVVAFVSLKVKNSGFETVSISDIPLNPRIHPVNEVSVYPVYVIISLSILSNP